LLAVGRKAREHLEPFVAGQFAGDAPRRGNAVEVAGVGEDDVLVVNGREAQQSRLALALRGGGAGQQEDDGKDDTSVHGTLTLCNEKMISPTRGPGWFSNGC